MNKICIYCNNTGWTKEDPYHCNHCGRDFISKEKTDNDKEKDLFLNTISNFEYAQQWSSNYMINLLKSRGISCTNAQHNTIKVIDGIIENIKTNHIDNSQIIIHLDSIMYEVLIYWAYKVLLTSYKEDFKVTDCIYNIKLIPNNLDPNSDVIENQIVCIEYNTTNTSYLNKLFEVLTIRKRKGLPTFVITNQPYSLFYNAGNYSVHNSKDYKIDPFSTATFI